MSRANELQGSGDGSVDRRADGGGKGRDAKGRPRRGLRWLIEVCLLGLGVSSPDERRENFRKWERYRKLQEAERAYYGQTLDEAVKADQAARDREAEGGSDDGGAVREG